MNMTEVFEVLRFSTPVIMQLVYISLLIRGCAWGNESSRMKLTRLLIAAKTCSIVSWTSALIFTFAPAFFVHIHCIFFLGVLLNTVFFYHFVHILTQTDKQRHFSYLHYAVPLVIVGALAIWSFFVPFDVRLYIVTHYGQSAKGYELYSAFFASKMPTNAIYHLLYISLAFIRLNRYRKAVANYSADIASTSMRWLYIFMYTSIFTIPITTSLVIIPLELLLNSLFIVIPVLLVMFQGSIITYSTIMGKYVIIYDGDQYNYQDSDRIKNAVIIRELELYMQTHKPYLNPNLKITDLSLALTTNRSRLSQLINQHYGMNFCRWINKYRLQQVEALALNSKLSTIERVESSGFSNYRSYVRFKKQIESEGVQPTQTDDL